jgi:adenosine deaminase
MPKVELHVHLEGAVPPATWLELARRRRVDLPADSEAGLREWFRFRDFEHFVEVYVTLSRCLQRPEDFQLAVDGFAAEQARQNVSYTEAHFTIGTHLKHGGSASEPRDALAEALADAERRHGVRVRLIPDVVRNVPFRFADQTLEWALEMKDRGVVALGLSGIEATHSSHPFREHFRVAAAEGLHRVAHAGEHAGAHSVRGVLEDCGAERVGHGVRVLEDPELARELAESGIALEVCPSSNVCLGVVPDLASHPFERLRAAGLVTTVNSDDPPLFGTTLTGEYQRLASTFAYDAATLAGFALTAPRCSFLPPAEREERERDFRRQVAGLGEELLGERVEPLLPAPVAAGASQATGRA